MPQNKKKSADNVHNGHRKRVKEQMLSGAFNDKTPTHLLLETLLYFSVPRQDTNPIAHELMNRFGSLNNVLSADPSELKKVRGVTDNTAALFEIMRHINRRTEKERADKKHFLFSRDAVGEYLYKRMRDYKNETVALLLTRQTGEILAFEIIGEGDISSVGVSTRKVLELCLRHNATHAVLCHNHPSGTALPSQQDIEVTRGVSNALRQVQIRLYDHVVVTKDDYVSMASSNLYKNLF